MNYYYALLLIVGLALIYWKRKYLTDMSKILIAVAILVFVAVMTALQNSRQKDPYVKQVFKDLAADQQTEATKEIKHAITRLHRKKQRIEDAHAAAVADSDPDSPDDDTVDFLSKL